MCDWKGVEDKEVINVEAKGRNLEQLLVAFLEEILVLLETRGFLLHTPEELTITKKKTGFILNSRFLGDTNLEKYEIYSEVKAITYNEMKIESNHGFTIQVVVDM